MNRDRHILYVEDDPAAAELVKTYLEHELPDVVVETRTSADGAEEALNRRCYDLLILDLCLPGALGTDIARKVLERDHTQPIHLISAYRGPECQKLAADVGLTLEPKIGDITPVGFLECVRCKLAWRPCGPSAVSPLRPIQIIPPSIKEVRAAA